MQKRGRGRRRHKEGNVVDGEGEGEGRGGKFDNLSRCFWPVVRLSFICFGFFCASGSKSQRRRSSSSCRCARIPVATHTHSHTHTWFNNSTIAAGKFLFYLWQFLLSLTTKNQILKWCSLNNKTNTDNKVIKKRFVQAFLFFHFFFLFFILLFVFAAIKKCSSSLLKFCS